jgi:hypothetical protein
MDADRLGGGDAVKSRVSTVEVLPAFRLSVRFADDVEGIVDMNALVHSQGAGVFAVLADPKLFAQAAIEHGVVTWPGEIDLAPDAMYAAIEASGKWVLA